MGRVAVKRLAWRSQHGAAEPPEGFRIGFQFAEGQTVRRLA